MRLQALYVKYSTRIISFNPPTTLQREGGGLDAQENSQLIYN